MQNMSTPVDDLHRGILQYPVNNTTATDEIKSWVLLHVTTGLL